MEDLMSPLQEQMEEWKRGVNSLDKDHAKGNSNLCNIYVSIIWSIRIVMYGTIFLSQVNRMQSHAEKTWLFVLIRV